MGAVALWVVFSAFLSSLLDHAGRYPNLLAVSSVALILDLAATILCWMGFVYSRRSASDRGLLLLVGVLGFAVTTVTVLAAQPRL
jgi:hypothetical protein